MGLHISLEGHAVFVYGIIVTYFKSVIFISAWALALLVLQYRAIARAYVRRTGKWQFPRLFLCVRTSKTKLKIYLTVLFGGAG